RRPRRGCITTRPEGAPEALTPVAAVRRQASGRPSRGSPGTRVVPILAANGNPRPAPRQSLLDRRRRAAVRRTAAAASPRFRGVGGLPGTVRSDARPGTCAGIRAAPLPAARLHDAGQLAQAD